MRARLAVGLACALVGAAAVTASPAATAAPPSAPPGPVAAEQARAGATARAIGLAADESLSARSVVVDAAGVRHVRFERTSGGLRVVGGDLVVALDAAGSAREVHWNRSQNVVVGSRQARVSAAAARATASSAAGYAVSAASSELVVWAMEGAPRLAWEVLTTGVRANGTPSRLLSYVDAQTGALVDAWDEIADGTGNTEYSGTVGLATTQLSATSFAMKDSIGHSVSDLNGATNGAGTLFTGSDDVWGTGSPSARDTAAADALWGAQETYAYYLAVHGRAGIWGTGKGAPSRVHYGNAYVNAFWDGTQMTYGDGAGNTHPLTSIDVAGHEMSHGITENTAKLAYRKESGGLNEATSDIFGTAVECYAGTNADPCDYLIGEKIDIFGNGSPLRYMDKPSRDGRSADCWSSSLGRLDVHYSSGPLNHWFYLVSEGSGAKTIGGVSYNSPVCGAAPAVTGAGRTVAEKVWYRTLTTKLTSSSTYAAAREGAIASAKELYGAGSTQCKSVEAACTAIAVRKGVAAC